MCFGSKDRNEPTNAPVQLQDLPSRRPQNAPIPPRGAGATRPQAGTARPRQQALISKRKMRRDITLDACQRIARAMNGSRYALVGGAACIALGARRATADLDIIVPQGRKKAIQRMIAQQDGFGEHPISNVPWIRANDGECHTVDVIEPGSIYAIFDRNTPTIQYNGLTVLHPAYILRTKIISWSSVDRVGDKHNSDELDIVFLTQFMVQERMVTSPRIVDVADEDFFDIFLPRRPEAKENFRAIGLYPGSRSRSRTHGTSSGSGSNSDQSRRRR